MVLLVERNKDLGDCYEEFFKLRGQKSLQVDSPQKALALLSENSSDFSLVITDLSLVKKYDGLAMACALKSNFSISIILISESEPPLLGDALPFDAVLEKLTALDQLDGVLKNLGL